MIHHRHDRLARDLRVRGGFSYHPATGIPDPKCRPARRRDNSGVNGSALLESVLDFLASLLEVAHALIGLALIFHLLVVRRLANVFLGAPAASSFLFLTLSSQPITGSLLVR